MKLYLVEICVLCAIGIARAAVIAVDEKATTTITCDLSVQYPTWTGPGTLAEPLTSGQTINEEGIEWVNNKDLKIAKAMLKHNGTYTCSDTSGNSKSVDVDVQYFHAASAVLSTASPQNTTSVFTCYCLSNPDCTIVPSTVSHKTIGDNIQHTEIFHGCEPDSTNDNRNKCSLTATLTMAKEFNGLMENSCQFGYKNNEKFTTLTASNKFYFPPTSVNMTTKESPELVAVNCVTDSSNPVAVLNWYKGTNSVATVNSAMTGSYDEVVLDAEYNGKNISQMLDVKIDDIKENERIFCCAKQLQTEICESIQLDSFRDTSGGFIPTAWMSLLVVCVIIGLL